MGTIFALFLAFTVPLVFLAIVYKLDFYQTGQFRFVLLSFMWGIIAYYMAVFANRFLAIYSGLSDWDAVIRFWAPTLEEIFKGIFILILIYGAAVIVKIEKWLFPHSSHRPPFTYSVDGAVYGFAIGVGFAVIENYEYTIGESSLALFIAFQRVFSTNLIHASSSAIIGIALGMFILERSPSRWLIFFSGICLAIGQHMYFNNLVSNGTYLFVVFGAGFLGASFIYLAMLRGRKQAQGWIKEKLGMADQVTDGEARLVQHLGDLDEVLQPVYQRFGPEKTDLVEKFLRLQARLGIKRKTLDSLDDKLRAAVEAEMKTMRQEMNEIRREAGTYVMVFVRSVYTEDVVSVWNQMQEKVNQQSEATGGQKGGGVWSSIDDHIKPSSKPEGIE